ncbi:MAG: SWIM zinc finger family protein [Gemmataceae bacterium]
MKTVARRKHQPPRREPPRDHTRPSAPLAAQGGIKAQSRQGDFGQSWWANRWQAVLDSFRVGGRLARGRLYARQGQVLNIDIAEGKVTARVQGSRPEPYAVSVAVKELTPGQWAAVVEHLSRSALFVAKLLAGEMPTDIEKAFTQADLSLFPEKRGDLRTDCSCPDEANPCKHIAAVYYLLGEEFDRDPFLLFRLRGMERDRLLGMLNKAPADDAPKEVLRDALPVDVKAFWTLGPVADDFAGEAATPAVTAGLVRRLGNFPFWRGERQLLDAVEAAYVASSELGVRTFLGEQVQG